MMASLSRMRFEQTFVVVVFIIYISVGTILPLCFGCFGDECRNIEFKEPVSNKAMKNHVFRSEVVLNEGSCRLLCYMEPNCVSINFGPLEGGKFVKCELNNITDENHLETQQTFTFLAIENLCNSSPCLNNGTCQAGFTSNGYRCICRAGFTGTICQKAPNSCKELYDENNRYFGSGPFTKSEKMPFWSGDGAWTPVMKIDGAKPTFHYNSKYWSNKTEHNLLGGETGFDAQETKLPSYWNTSFTKICLGMKITQKINFIVINKTADSLYSLIADGQYRHTSLGRDTWKKLIGSEASLQLHCNMEGFNCKSSNTPFKARIGILGNQENDCKTCDSRIGFGTGGNPDDSNTCGNVGTPHEPDNGEKYITAMGYILVQ